MKVIATLPKRKPTPEYDMTGIVPPRPTPAEATLVFLNEIEKNTVKAADAAAALLTMPETLVKALEMQTSSLLPQPYPEAKAIDLTPVVNATLSLANTIQQSGNKSDTLLARQVESLIETNRAIIAQLEILNKLKKWKFEIDRNYTTQRIQSIIAKEIDE
jgi:hypothetical protein